MAMPGMELLAQWIKQQYSRPEVIIRWEDEIECDRESVDNFEGFFATGYDRNMQVVLPPTPLCLERVAYAGVYFKKVQWFSETTRVVDKVAISNKSGEPLAILEVYCLPRPILAGDTFSIENIHITVS